MITVFACDGIGGQGGVGAMAQNVIRPLVATGRYDWQDVSYAANIGPVGNDHNVFSDTWLRKSDIDGARKLAEAIHATPNIAAAVVGYSGGASATSRLLEDMRIGVPYTRGLEVAWAVTIANPRRRRGPDAPGFGVAGEHLTFPSDVTHFEVANPDDGICCCPEYSPLRRLTDMGQDGPDPRAWLWMIERGEWQATLPKAPPEFSDPRFWWPPRASTTEAVKKYAWLHAEAVNGWLSAGRYLRGYLDGTAHGSDYVTRRLCDPIVRQILEMGR